MSDSTDTPRSRSAAGRQTLSTPAGLHADVVAGRFAGILQYIANPVANTLAATRVYAGLPADELFPVPKALPDVRVSPRWRLPGVRSEDLVFPSLHVPIEPAFRRRYQREYGETHQVYARRICPAAAGRRPRLLYLHGYMQAESYLEELTLLTGMALQLNVEVVHMQPPYHGRRTPRGSRFSGEFYFTADLVRSVEALRQTLLDARTVLALLRAEDDRPVGVTGLSLGGALTASLACLDERFAFAVPLIGHMDLAALVRDAPVLAAMRRDLQAFGWGRRQFAHFVESLGWNALAPKLPPERLCIMAASEDRFFHPRIVTRMWHRWGEPPIEWYPSSHMGFIAHLPQALRAMRAFIDRCDGG